MSVQKKKFHQNPLFVAIIFSLIHFSPVFAQTAQEDYQQWLEHYNAWDKLNVLYSQGEQSAENILKQARVSLQAGNPEQALQILEKESFVQYDDTAEADRLWICAQAKRALGNPEQAVYFYLQASEFMPSKMMQKRFKDEPGLSPVWEDIFRILFRTYVYNKGISRKKQEAYLLRLLKAGDTAWPHNEFWQNAEQILSQTSGAVTTKEILTKERLTDLDLAQRNLSQSIRQKIAKAITASAIGREQSMQASLDSISNTDIATGWEYFLSALKAPKPVPNIPYSRAFTFFSQTPKGILPDFANNWDFKPRSKAFKDFQKNIRGLSLIQIHTLFLEEKEESLMIDPVPKAELLPYRLAIAILNEDEQEASLVWNLCKLEPLPLGLKFAGQIFLDLEFEQVFGHVADFSNKKDILWLTLMEAAGYTPPLPHLIPFWKKINPAIDKSTLARLWPLDPDVMFKVWEYEWEQQHTTETARRLAHLYPQTQLGMACILHLAKKALTDKQIDLAQYYLEKVHPGETNSTLTGEYYQIQADWYISTENVDGAYASYQCLIDSGVPIDDTTRLKIAFLLQQRGDLYQGRKHLLALWEKKDEFPTSMQAEILYYLAEGDQASGQLDTALDSYLHLAWKYPQESMWALTAMYRAACIYESKEQYKPAASLLSTVVKNAATAKQREAAKAKLESIKAHMSKNTENEVEGTPYPF